MEFTLTIPTGSIEVKCSLCNDVMGYQKDKEIVVNGDYHYHHGFVCKKCVLKMRMGGA